MSKKNPSKFLTKVRIFNLLLCIIPVALVGSFSYFNSYQAIQQKVYEGNVLLVEQTKSRVEQLMRKIDTSAIQLITSPSMEEWLDVQLTPREFNTVTEIKASLHRLQSFDTGIQDIFLLNVENDWIIGNHIIDNVMTSPYRNLLDYSKVQTDTMWISSGSDLPQNPIVDSQLLGSEPFVALIKRIPIISERARGFLIVKISSHEIEKLLLKNNKLGEVTILDETNRLLAAQNEVLSQSEINAIVSRFADPAATHSEQYYPIIELNGEKQAVLLQKSHYNQWSYVSVIPVTEYARDSRAIGNITLIVCALIIMGFVFIALKGSQKIYRPIKGIFNTAASDLDASSGWNERDEIHFIEQRLRALISGEKELRLKAESYRDQLKEFYILQLYNGQIRDKELPEKLRYFDHYERFERYMMICSQIDTLEGTRYDPQDRDLMLFAIQNIVQHLIPQDRLIHATVMGQEVVFFIGDLTGDEDAFTRDTYEMIKKLQGTLKQLLDLQVSFGVSRIFDDAALVARACKESHNALKYTLKFGEESIIFLHEVQSHNEISLYFPENKEAELLDMIRFSDVDVVRKLLHQILGEIFENSANYENCQMSLVRLMIDIMRLVQNVKVGKHSLAWEYAMFQQIFTIRTLPEAEAWFMDTVIEPVMNYVHKENESQSAKIVEGIVELIKQDQELTLEECANKLKYHPSHLKKVFKQFTGMNFSDYVTAYKLDLAKKLLRESDIKIAEIAEKLKYNNTQNFIRFFKKMEGMTPGQYRETMQNKLNGG